MIKLIKNNWQLIAFYIVAIVLVIMWVGHVEKTNEIITNQKNNRIEESR